MNLFHFFTILKNILKILKNERHDTNFGYVFITRFHFTHKNFLDEWTNSYTVIVSIFLKNAIFINIEIFFIIHMDSEKSINLFKIKKV